MEKPLKYAYEKKNWVKKKADKNRRNSNILIFGILLSSAVTPVLILFQADKYFEGFWVEFYNKLLPSLFSMFATLATGWCQLRKPQERWILQRTVEKEIEFEITSFEYGINEYFDKATSESKLVEKVNSLLLKLHYEWVKITPTSRDIKGIEKTKS